MIPNYTSCDPLPEMGCRSLFDKLESIKTLALATVLANLPEEMGCGEGDMEGFISLNPIAVDVGNYLIVYPEPLSLAFGAPKMAKATLPGMMQARAGASLVGVFNGWPTVEVEEGTGVFTVPSPDEASAAARFVISIGFCVFCALWDGISAGTLLGTRDATIARFEFADLGGGQAGFEATITWVQE